MLIFELNTLSRIITLFAFLSVALVTGLLTSRLTRKERILKDADSRLEFMLFFNKVLFQSKGLTEMLDLALKKLKASFNADFGFILSQREQDKALKKELEEFVIGGLLLNKKEFQAATWAFENLRPCGRFTQTYSDVKGTYLPLAYADNCYGVLCLISKEREISSIELTLLEDVSRYCALALMQSSFDIK